MKTIYGHSYSDRLLTLLCVCMIYRLQQLSLFILRKDHLAAVNFRAKRGTRRQGF